jgi:hypothetical protein
MLNSRSCKLSTFYRSVEVAWDMGKQDGKRTILYESVNLTVFKNDPEQRNLKVPEFNFIGLEPMEYGSEGLGAVELRSSLETKPITQRVSELGQM